MKNYQIILLVFLITSCIATKDTIVKRHGKIQLTGIAIDAKAGAIIRSSEGAIFYIDAMSTWGRENIDRKVIVRGKFISIEHKAQEDSIPRQQLHGIQRVIRRPKFEFID